MRKLRLSFVLAVLQLLIAVTLDIWASRESPPFGLDTLYAPTAWLVCRGINAPAWLVERLLTWLSPLSHLDKAPLALLGVGLHEYFFLLLVFMLWTAVGASVKRLWNANTAAQNLQRNWLFILSMALLAATLFFLGLLRISKLPNFNNPVGSALQGALFIVWGLAIAFFALFRGRILRSRRSQFPSAATP